MRSIGPRSADTARILPEFQDNKAVVQANLRKQSDRLSEMARVNRALRLGRVPKAAANVARVLDRDGLPRRNVTIAGTNSIFAYEAAAGGFVDTSMLATGDLDILFDARVRLRLRAEAEPPSLMAREPLKRARDIAQAKTVAAMVNNHMPNLPFEPEHRASFPMSAASLATEHDFFRFA